jgi:hypothetical protein
MNYHVHCCENLHSLPYFVFVICLIAAIFKNVKVLLQFKPFPILLLLFYSWWIHKYHIFQFQYKCEVLTHVSFVGVIKFIQKNSGKDVILTFHKLLSQQQPWLMGHHATFSYYSYCFCHLAMSMTVDADTTTLQGNRVQARTDVAGFLQQYLVIQYSLAHELMYWTYKVMVMGFYHVRIYY